MVLGSRMQPRILSVLLALLFLLVFSLEHVEKILAVNGDPIKQYNQSQTANITGNASTEDQTTINSYLNVNRDDLTWDITETQVGTSYTYPVLNQNFTSDASGWVYGEVDPNGVATGTWESTGGNFDPGVYHMNHNDGLAIANPTSEQWINYSFTVSSTPTSARVYAYYRLVTDDDTQFTPYVRLILPNESEYDLYVGSTVTVAGDTGWVSVDVDASDYFQDLTGTYTLKLYVITGPAPKNADRPTNDAYWDDAGVELIYSNYRVSVEHNATGVSYSGILNNVNVSINFTSTLDDVYNMTIYNFVSSSWDSSQCQNQSVIAGNYYTIWCNITSNPTSYISDGNIRIRLNSTTDMDRGTLKEEYVQYYVSYQVGYLEVELISPDPLVTTNIPQNNTFLVNATILCKSGPCGNVYGTVRYNLTSPYPDTPINTSEGDRPFYVQEPPYPSQALKACPTNPLDANEFCNLTWTVNATGDIDTSWKVGVLFNSSYSEIQWNHTRNATVSITSCTEEISLAWTSIDFGLLTPSTNYNSAPYNNQNFYNITNRGTCILNLWIKGIDLQNTTYNSIIKVGNLSWSNYSSSYTEFHENMTYSYVLLDLSLPSGENLTTYYWLSVPPVYAGYYKGSVYICGNYTSIC
jgi:hypothetical protein